jgi:GxxExxY protein
LGSGFLEKVYENALSHEIRKLRLHVEQQRPVHVAYDGEIVGDHVPDLTVEECLIVEIKAVSSLERIHRMQCLNYLRDTGHHLRLLFNFGRPQLEVARIVWQL